MTDKKLSRYIMPNILAMVGTSFYILADTFFVAAAAGSNGITALNLVLPLYGLIFATGSMIGIGSATRYSLNKSIGETDYSDYFFNSVFWTIAVSLLFVSAGCFFPELILKTLGADSAVLNLALPYTRIVLCFAPFFMLNYTFTAFTRNDGSPDIAMAATLLSGIFNIAFDYIFMFPMKMGMIGAALATGISPVVSMLICMFHYLSDKSSIKFTVKIPSIKKLLLSCGLGAAAFVGEMSSGITTMVFNFILLDKAGNTAVAAYGVIANAALVGTAMLNGVAQGLQPLASESHGKADRVAEKRILRNSVISAEIIAVLLVLSVVFFAEEFVSVFNSDNSAELKSYAVFGIRLYFPGFLFAAFNIVYAGFLSATGKGRESSVTALSRGIAAIVLFAFLLSEAIGITGVWLAFPAAEIFTLIIGMLLSGKRCSVHKNNIQV